MQAHGHIRRRLAALALLGSALLPHAGLAQSADRYPSRPIRMIVTWSAGGPVDAGARAVAAALSTSLGEQVVVDNRPGANGAVGSEAAARAAPDGYTILVGNADTFNINPNLYPHLRYSPTAFAPIAPLGTMPQALTLRSQFQGHTPADVVKLAKAQPGKLTYGSWGVGSLGHLGIAMFEQEAGIDMLHVPYQGGAPAIAAIMANQIDMLVTQVSLAESQQKSGKVKILGVTSAARSRIFPHIPTISEQGYPAYVAEQWVGFFFPPGTPERLVETVNREINAFLKSPAGAAQLAQIGFEATGGSPADLRELVVKGIERWGRTIRERRITIAQ